MAKDPMPFNEMMRLITKPAIVDNRPKSNAANIEGAAPPEITCSEWVDALAESWERRLAEMDTLKLTDYIEGSRDAERRCLRELRSCAGSAATDGGERRRE